MLLDIPLYSNLSVSTSRLWYIEGTGQILLPHLVSGKRYIDVASARSLDDVRDWSYP
jgi:hypothetical protein